MNVLLTNDDGFDSELLRMLCRAFAARGHRVTVSAPATQQSAKSHSFTLSIPLMVHKRDMEGAAEAWAVEGTPVDSARVGFMSLATAPIDLVVSGDLSAGMERILIGLCKKVLVADKIAALTEYYFTGVGLGNSFSVPGLWIGSVAYSLQLYYDFSGYSDMAVGIGQLLGFRIRENFNRPYLAGSLTEFWRRWHMSLTQWFRDYVYIPLGGNRCAPARHLFNMLVVWLLTGFWHGAGWTFVLWGLGYFVLLSAEKYLLLPQGKGGKLIGHIYTLFFVNLLWVLFRSPSLAVFGRYIAGMFGGGSGALEYKALRFIPLLALAAVLCLPWSRWLSGFSGKKWFSLLRGLLLLILLVLALSAVVNASYVPYIYGNF